MLTREAPCRFAMAGQVGRREFFARCALHLKFSLFALAAITILNIAASTCLTKEQSDCQFPAKHHLPSRSLSRQPHSRVQRKPWNSPCQHVSACGPSVGSRLALTRLPRHRVISSKALVSPKYRYSLFWLINCNSLSTGANLIACARSHETH